MGFKEVCRDIKSLKIQGAMSIAIAGIKAMSMKGFDEKKILSLRPTEPALRNGIKFAKKHGQKEALNYYHETQNKINKVAYKKVKGVVFTHCHSNTVINLLKYAKNKGNKFKVYNTETRPMYQGRKTAKDLSKAGINITMIPDSAVGFLFRKTDIIPDRPDIILFGADAILRNGDVINKVGSNLFAEFAHHEHLPLYMVTQGWKFSKRFVKIEERNIHEIWENAPKHVKIKNPAFERVENEFITGIISEFGILKPKEFVKKVRREYKWI